ncbi:MAG: NAD(P)H-hydrate epimerase, partial [Bacteroidota bacterium]
MLLSDATQIRMADQIMIEEHAFAGILLMETAGRKSTEFILQHFPNQNLYLVLAGPGNNGGDGLVIARYLKLAGKNVRILMSHPAEKYKGDAKINFDALKGANVPMGEWGKVEIPEIKPGDAAVLLIDALLGTGVKSEVRGTIADMLTHFRPLDLPCIAIDLPSGHFADTGAAPPQSGLRAQHTLTFQLPKIAHYVYPAAESCGEVHAVDIGIWPQVVRALGIRRHLLDQATCAAFLAARPTEGHKGTFGHVLSIGGSARYAGAIALTGHAALHIGAGLSSVFAPEATRTALFETGPEVMLAATSDSSLQPQDVAACRAFMDERGIQTLAIGPGMESGPEQASFLRALLLGMRAPAVFDADALNLIAQHPKFLDLLPNGSILTPHPGEMGRLAPEGPYCKTHRLEAAEAFAQSSG